MQVVSNTSPLSALSIIGRLGLLRAQFGTIRIPKAVWTELSRLEHTSGKQALETWCHRVLHLRPAAVTHGRRHRLDGHILTTFMKTPRKSAQIYAVFKHILAGLSFFDVTRNEVIN